MIRICLIYDKLRFEEKKIFSNIREKGFDATLVDGKSLTFDTESSKGDSRFGDVVLQRLISYNRGLHLTYCLEHTGLPVADRVLFGRQAERVEAHRVHHAPALHPGRAAHDVGRRVSFGMPDVQPVAAGVGEHVERVELLRARLRQPRRGKRLVLLPIRLPLGLDRGVVVAGHGERTEVRGRRTERRQTLAD